MPRSRLSESLGMEHDCRFWAALSEVSRLNSTKRDETIAVVMMARPRGWLFRSIATTATMEA